MSLLDVSSDVSACWDFSRQKRLVFVTCCSLDKYNVLDYSVVSKELPVVNVIIKDFSKRQIIEVNSKWAVFT